MASVAMYVVFFVGLFLVIDAKESDFCKVQPPIKEDFEILKTAGRWYEFARYPNMYENVTTERCYTYLMTVEGNDVHVTITYIRKHESWEERRNLEGEMTSVPDSPGKVRITMPSVGLDNIFNIVDAKYDDYVITYLCDISSVYKVEYATILTRDVPLSDAKKKSLLEKLKSLKIDTERLEFDPKNNC
ncbi:apolipoprotein D-like [Stegodyphus dumicola]|uniref:apolipoprotein D-like n=1 Tax=Stegodyphus dumicola TaxID=202533 RepID=UPI0015AC3876|nr:apolipoprotein D-like [Stegodyphus dumicola]